MKKEVLAQELAKRGIEYSETEAFKGGQKLTGFAIKTDRCVSPVIYPALIADDANIDELLESANGRDDELKAMVDLIADWSKIQKRIFAYVRPKTDDDSKIKTEFLDLEAVVFADLGDGTADIDKKILETWKVSEKEVWKLAIENIKENTDEVFRFMDDMVAIQSKEVKGSGVLLVPELFERYAEEMDDDLWLIPSSIHEILMIRKSSATEDDLKNMIRETNDTVVDACDILGYHPYKYGRFTNQITM